MSGLHLEESTPAQHAVELFLCDLIARQVQRTESGLTLQTALPVAGHLVAQVRRAVLRDTTSFSYYLDRLCAELDRLVLLPDAPRPAEEFLAAIEVVHAAFVKAKEA